MTDRLSTTGVLGRFQRLRVVGVVFIAVATVLSVAFGAWALAGGVVLGGATMLGWGAGSVRRVSNDRSIGGTRRLRTAEEFVMRADLGTFPVPSSAPYSSDRSDYAIAQFLGGFFPCLGLWRSL